VLELDRELAFPASSARAGRSRQSPVEVGRSTRSALGTALATAPFLVVHIADAAPSRECRRSPAISQLLRLERGDST
jgi:hypothetical protein